MKVKTIVWTVAAAAAIGFFGQVEAQPSRDGGRGAAIDKWVYMPCHFWGKDPALHSLAFFTNTVARARSIGYNGVLLSCHLDLSHQWPPHLVKQLTKAKAFCDAIGIEVIPMTWDVGYGGDCPGNWFESREVANLP